MLALLCLRPLFLSLFAHELFVGLTPKRAPDGELSRSLTSLLDPKAPLLRLPRSLRTWEASPVGRGLVDALASDAKNCLLCPRPRLISYSSLPKDCGGGRSQPELGKMMSCPAPDTAAAAAMSVPSSRFFFGDLKSGPEATGSDAAHLNDKQHFFDLGKLTGSGSLPASIAAGARRFIGPVSASEIEQSEDYTRIISRGPNPKTTHIFGDCILEPLPVGETDEAAMEGQEGAAESYWVVKCAEEAAACDDFLSSCFTCKKKLEGNDIYIYRGEKAFCSADCRDQEILIEEEAENTTTTTVDSPRSTCSSFQDEGIFMAGMVDKR